MRFLGLENTNSMRITKKQEEEIDYLTQFYCSVPPTLNNKKEYIERTVHGKKGIADGLTSENPLLAAKCNLDLEMAIKLQDIKDGLFMPIEVLDDEQIDHPFGKRLLKALSQNYKFETNFGWQMTHKAGLEMLKEMQISKV